MTHIAEINYNDTANASGVCVSVYLSGCDRHCKGCHNPEAQNFDYGVEATMEDILNIEKGLHNNGIERNLCILGGEPLNRQNIVFTLALCSYIKTASPDTKIYIWTGYTIEELLADECPVFNEIFKLIDVLIDGPYIEELRDITLKMRGSSNQRIHYLK